MSGHTPGPWKAEFDRKCCSVDILGHHGDPMRRRAMDGHGSVVIVDCAAREHDGGPFATPLAEQIANARLIAAAPDMLAALKALDAYWTESLPGGPDGPRTVMSGLGTVAEETMAVWRTTRAAITKAAAQPDNGETL